MKWPESFIAGALPVRIVPVPHEEFQDLEQDREDEHLTPSAFYDPESLTILYLSSLPQERSQARIDNDICHEIAHAWVDLILAHGHDLSEGEIQSLGNALQQLLVSVLKVNKE